MPLLYIAFNIFLLSINISFAINDPDKSNYFIGSFGVISFEFPVPYPPGICLQKGLSSNYIFYECSDDYETITKYTYSIYNDECIGDPEDTMTYKHESDISEGDLYDFNCAGKFNAMAYHTYLFDCNTAVGTAWVATDVCYKYLNLSNITGNLGNYPDARPEEYYQLSQMNSCDGCTVYTETFVGETCSPLDRPLSSYDADPECEFFFLTEGFKVYADVISCIKDGEDSFDINGTCQYIPTTTIEDESDSIMNTGYMCLMSIFIVFLYRL